MSFGSTIVELEQKVEQLESGVLALDEALRKFERGISLARAGQLKLDDAEQRVRISLSNSDDAPLSDFSDVAE
ncbi:exodeoxyribonuclease VII small subunit [Vibrio cholerae]|nr:exodeoxyribonuclease VII small subunit [Vibrio cholerae]